MPWQLYKTTFTDDRPDSGRELRNHYHRHVLYLKQSQDLQHYRREDQRKHRIAQH